MPLACSYQASPSNLGRAHPALLACRAPWPSPPDPAPGCLRLRSPGPPCSNEHYRPTTYCSDLALLELNASAQHSRPIGGTLQPGDFDFEHAAGEPLTAIGFGYTQ